jgi:Protein of unknown function (DUF2000)
MTLVRTSATSLSPGQAANAAVCVAAATAPVVPGLLGPGGPDAAEVWHPGLPWAGCSILAASSAQLAEIRRQPGHTESHGHRPAGKFLRQEPTVSRRPPAVTMTRRTRQAKPLIRNLKG